MAFLHRRNSRPQLSDMPLNPGNINAIQNIPVSPSRNAISTSIEKARSSRLITRVSTIFSPKKKRTRPPHMEPLCNMAVAPRRRGSGSSNHTFSSTSSDDIRPPSGLGFSVSRVDAMSSNISLPPPSGGRFVVNGHLERSRCMSSPEKLRSFFPTKDLAHTSVRDAPLIGGRRGNHHFKAVNFPPEILDVILSFLPRPVVASLSTVSGNFAAAVRRHLYETLDLRAIQAHHLEQVSSLLASRWDLAGLVHTLICNCWPPSSPPKTITRLSFLSSNVPTFSVALHNMHHLTTLTLPSFDNTILSDRTGFRLRNLTFLTSSMSSDQQTELFRWLTTQPDIVSLSFPNLVE
jgi:hypothetical protein